MSARERILLTAWAVVAAMAIGFQLGGYPLLDADEGRNAEVGREMAATNDYVMPRLDGLPYLDKPIVYFAAEAAAMELLGPTEFAARLPAWLFTILTALVLAWFASRVGIDAPVVAVIFLATPLTVAFARTVIFDSALSFFITVAIIAFYLERPALAWTAIGLGVITKGPVAIAVPLLAAIPYAVWRRRLRSLWSVAGLLLFVAVIAPWVWAISRAVPDFLHYVLVTETAQRLTTGALRRTGPLWYFVPFLIGGALPWSVAALGGRGAAGGEGEVWLDRFLILWISIPFLFFSLSQSKRPQYILPLMPAMALLVARRWKGSRAAAVALAIFGGVLLVAAPMARLRAEYADAAQRGAMVIGICAVLCGVIAFVSRPALALMALSIPVLAIPLATNPFMNALAVRRSTKAFVQQLTPYATGAEVIGIEAFSGSLAFYLQRPMVIVTPDGEELTSNYIIHHYSRYTNGPLRPPSWLPQAFDRSRPRVLLVRHDDQRNRALVEQHGARLIATSARFVAYTMPR